MSSPGSDASGDSYGQDDGLDYRKLSHDPDAAAHDASSHAGPSRKKPKVERAKKACLPCRSRKCKCGGAPPDSCPNCIDDKIPCQWPTEDGRSSQARKERSRAKRLLSMAARGLGRPPSKQNKQGHHGSSVQVVDDTSVVSVGSAVPPFEHDHWAPTLEGTWDSRTGMTPVLSYNTSAQPPHVHFDTTSHYAPAPQASDTTLSMNPAPAAYTFPSDMADVFDPAQFILAMSSQLPTVEEGSALDETSPSDNFGGSNSNGGGGAAGGAGNNAAGTGAGAKGKGRDTPGESRMVKITWWRPHGPTAIAPGLKRLSLKVRVDTNEPRNYPSPSGILPGMFGSTDDLFGPDGMPVVPIMHHLLDVFAERFGCQFPVLDHASLLSDLETGSGSVFLFNCIAATAARFSTHPAFATPTLKPHEYGNVFAKRAKDLLAPMLAVPSRETVMALVLLAHLGFANDSESEEWMFTGMAVRMAIDLGLHLDPGVESSDISIEERRLNRLTFWSVLLLDFALSFGTGRQTTFRIEEITQCLPTEDDVRPMTPNGSSVQQSQSTLPRSPFPFAARQMMTYGPLINLLNGRAGEEMLEIDKEIHASRSQAVAEYNRLPQDMHWNVTNLQQHRAAHQDSIFLHIHLWMHTIIASGYLTGAEYRRHQPRSTVASTAPSGHATPSGLSAANVWRNSARTIGDILVLSDVIDPYAYLALPFVNQAFYVAGCCYIKEIESHKTDEDSHQYQNQQQYHNDNPERRRGSKDTKQIDLFRSMLTSVATTSITTLQQGLARQTTYWSGVAWVAGALAQRVSGIKADDVDLVTVQEQLASYVSLPDAGLVERRRLQGGSNAALNAAYEGGHGHGGHAGGVAGSLPLDFGDFDLLALPFDLGSMGTGVSVEQELPLR